MFWEIEIKTMMADPNGVAYPGEIIKTDEKKALDLIAGGYAKLISKEIDKIETAIIKPPENEMIEQKMRGRPKGR